MPHRSTPCDTPEHASQESLFESGANGAGVFNDARTSQAVRNWFERRANEDDKEEFLRVFGSSCLNLSGEDAASKEDPPSEATAASFAPVEAVYADAAPLTTVVAAPKPQQRGPRKGMAVTATQRRNEMRMCVPVQWRHTRDTQARRHPPPTHPSSHHITSSPCAARSSRAAHTNSSHVALLLTSHVHAPSRLPFVGLSSVPAMTCSAKQVRRSASRARRAHVAAFDAARRARPQAAGEERGRRAAWHRAAGGNVEAAGRA